MKDRKAGNHIASRSEFRPVFVLSLALLWLLVFPPAARGQFALTAVSTIDFKGNSITVDSFNSQDPLHSDWQTALFYHGSNYGYYPSLDPAGKREANAVIATEGNIINVDTAAIYGYVITAPGGTASVMKNGSVGDTNWIGPYPNMPNNYGIQPGHADTNMNAAFPDVSLPPYAWTPLTSVNTNIGGINYAYVIDRWNGTYEIPGTLTASLYVAAFASNVTLYLPAGLHFGNGTVLTVGTNASLTIYSGDSISTSGSGCFNNVNRLALALSIYGLPPGIDSAGDNVNGCTGISLQNAGIGAGWIYAPNASLTLGGGGGAGYDVTGAFTVHDIQINGIYRFHYDESLTGPLAPRIISQPANRVVPSGSDVTVSASSIGSFLHRGYQWFFNETNLISNASLSSLFLTNVQLSDAGSYRVVITNLFGAATSAPATLLVYTNAAPLLSNFFCQNRQVTFNVSGVAGLSYSVQASTNLTDWTSLGTNTAPFLFADTNTALFSKRFYRSVFVP